MLGMSEQVNRATMITIICWSEECETPPALVARHHVLQLEARQILALAPDTASDTPRPTFSTHQRRHRTLYFMWRPRYGKSRSWRGDP